MKKVYKSKELVKAEYIIEQLKDVKPEHTATLIQLVNNYNTLAKLVNDIEEIPPVESFDKKSDVAFEGLFCYTEKGADKIQTIKSKCTQYVSLHTPIPPTIEQVNGWKKSNVIAIISIGFPLLFSIGYHQGQNSEKDRQYKEIKALERNNTSLSDSLKLLKSKFPMNLEKDICSDTIKTIQKDTVKLVQTDTIRDTIKIKEKNLLNKERNDIYEKNEACILRNEIKSINPDYGHVAGYLESIAERFKKFAKRNAIESVENCSPLGDDLGYLNECGRKVLESIKGILDLYIRNNKAKCNN